MESWVLSDLTFAWWIKANKLSSEEPSDGRRVQLKILRGGQARGGGGAPLRAVVGVQGKELLK